MTATIVMAMCHTLMMALSPDLSGGERKSHHLSDSKTVQSLPCAPVCQTAVKLCQTAVKLCLVQMALRHQIKKSAYFPGEKITRTQMLVRVFAKSIT